MASPAILTQIAMSRKPSAPVTVDARGRTCPEPVLMLRAALRDATVGTRVRLLATDPLAAVDVKAYCLRSGHALVADDATDEGLEFVVERR